MALGVLFYEKVTAEKVPEQDRATLCPIDGPRSITVVLIDTTDDLSEIAKSDLLVRLIDLAKATPRYGLLELRRLSPAQPGGHVLFSKCNPGDGSDQNELTGNPQLRKKKWVEEFQSPLQAELQTGLKDEAASSSPIMATIQHIAIERFSSTGVADLPKKLIIVSDMIEYGPNYSQYSGDLTYEHYKKTLAYKEFRTDLHSASVTIDYIQRKTRKPINSAEHIRFWEKWIEDNRGRVVSAHKIQGLQ